MVLLIASDKGGTGKTTVATNLALTLARSARVQLVDADVEELNARTASRLSKVLEDYGFEVVSVVCKVGCTPKEEIGIKDHEKVRIGEFESMCSPIAQAEVLNEACTDFNIVLGLCVGHDSLFFKHSKAPVTVFAAKDRVLGHNPLAAIYTLGSYYERFAKSRTTG